MLPIILNYQPKNLLVISHLEFSIFVFVFRNTWPDLTYLIVRHENRTKMQKSSFKICTLWHCYTETETGKIRQKNYSFGNVLHFFSIFKYRVTIIMITGNIWVGNSELLAARLTCKRRLRTWQLFTWCPKFQFDSQVCHHKILNMLLTRQKKSQTFSSYGRYVMRYFFIWI